MEVTPKASANANGAVSADSVKASLSSSPPPRGVKERESKTNEDGEDDKCRICYNPSESKNPLRHPCACSGSMKYVHQDCFFQWLDLRQACKCEVCKREISFSPVYAENTPARLSFQEFVVGMVIKAFHVLQFFLCRSFVLSVRLFIRPFITFWMWQLCFVGSFSEAHRLFLSHLSTKVILTDCLLGFLLSAGIVLIFISGTLMRDCLRHLHELEGQDAESEDEGDRNGARAERRPPGLANRNNAGDGNGEDVNGAQGIARAGQIIRRNAGNVVAWWEMQGPVFHLVENAFRITLDHMMPLVDESWRVKFERVREEGFYRLQGVWVFRETIVMKLLTALCVPCVLARVVFPVLGINCNDLYAFIIGSYIIWKLIAAFIIGSYIKTIIKRSPLLSIWIVVIPVLIGLLFKLLVIVPMRVPVDESPVFLLYKEDWARGVILFEIWVRLIRFDHMMPLVDKSWREKFERVREEGFSQGLWVLREIMFPIITKLLTALCVPYVLVRGVFPVLGYPLIVNSAVYRFAWLGCICISLLCFYAKRYHVWGFCIRLLGFCAKRFHVWFTNLHNSIRDDRYLIGRRLHNFGERIEEEKQTEAGTSSETQHSYLRDTGLIRHDRAEAC